MERVRINNYSKTVGEKIIRSWKAYRELFGLENEIFNKLRDEGKTEDEINTVLEKRKKDIKTLWPELKKEL